MPTLEEKQVYFDQYWQLQSEDKTDPRSLQRAGIVHGLLSKESGRLFDVGCGRGVILDYFAGLGYEVTGTDVSPDAITMVTQKGHRAIILDIERDESNEKYDIVFCLEVFPQLFYPLKVLKRLKDAMEDDGEMIVSVPNEFHIVSRLKLLFNKSHICSLDHSHVKLYTPPRDRVLFARSNLKIVAARYVPIVPPRWKILSKLFMPLAQIFPSLFAISSIYKLRK